MVNPVFTFGVLEFFAQIISAAAIVYAAILAKSAFSDFHRDRLAQNRVDVAAESLAAMYQVQEIFRHIRRAIRTSASGTTPKDILDSYIDDLNVHNEFFENFRRMKARTKAYFGSSAASQFDRVSNARAEIIWAIQDSYADLSNRDTSSENREESIRRRKTLYSLSDEDDLSKEIKGAIEDLEAILLPILRHS
jgi:hypothetical protein